MSAEVPPITESTAHHDRKQAEPGAGVDLVIAGAGVIGLTCAWRAARAGMTVCVVEPGAVGSGASSVAAGMLAPAGEAQWGQPDLTDACLESGRAWPRFADELESESGIPLGFERLGALHLAADRDEAAELKRRLPLIQAADPGAAWLLPSACRELEPGLTGAAGPGIEIPSEAAVDPRAVLDALSAAAAGAGVSVIEGTSVSGLLTEGSAGSPRRINGALLSSGDEIRAEHVLVAAGAWSGSLAWIPPAARVRVRAVKGEVLRLFSETRPADRIIHTERVYIVPRASGEIVVGATTEEAGFDVAVKAGGVHELLREAYRVLPEIAECEFAEASAGLRPATEDGAPCIGPTEIPGLHLATGHYRNGVLLAPLTADAVVAAIRDEAGPRAAEALRPAGRSSSAHSPQ